MSRNLFPCRSIGSQLGSPALMERAAAWASEIYQELEAQEFCGDEVQVHTLMPELRRDTSWLPRDLLRAEGLEPLPREKWGMVSTASVDPHEDFHGPTLLWTLFNDRLTLKVGRMVCVPQVGELILFDDRQSHGVNAPKGRGTLLLMVSVPLRPI